MPITSILPDAAILQMLGERIERYRIEQGLTQAELAERAGIGKRTLERVESGHGAELVTLIRILRILNVLDGFETLIPQLPSSPIEQLKLRGKQRRRVSHPRVRRGNGPPHEVRESTATKPWTWRMPPPEGLPPAKGSRLTKRRR